MTQADIRAALSDRQALLCTLYGEAAGEPLDGQIAVATAIRNRVLADLGSDGKPDWWGEGFHDVCLASWQFSCWWEANSPNTARVYALAESLVTPAPQLTADQALVLRLGWIADGVITDAAPDLTRGATHYVTLALLKAAPPKWSVGLTPCAVIGNHAFFRGVA